ncbi:MAG: alanine racemase, partial [Clostridia bacterium]|nr:alanine racemase [Clostridia bacterium]
MANFAGRPVWAEVDLGAVAHNLAEIRRQVGEKTAVMAVVKANAYGHGLREVARALSRAGAAWLGVAVPEEALELRELGLEQAILVLSHTPAKTMVEAIKQDIRLTVYSAHQQKDLVDAARRAGKRAKIHLKVDTGMGRLGFPPSPAGLEEMRAIAAAPEVEAEGIFTHFASADEEDASFTRYQLGLFREVLARLAA